jgi:predicted transcriptional regulator
MDDNQILPLDDITFSQAELAGIEEALAEARAGALIDFDDVMAWLNSLDTDHPLPRPEPPTLGQK